MANRKQKEKLRHDLINMLEQRGYPKEFGILIANELATDKSIAMMTGYLKHEKNAGTEAIVDEMLAICSLRDQWRQKKISEYNNSQYNELLLRGLDEKMTECKGTGAFESGDHKTMPF